MHDFDSPEVAGLRADAALDAAEGERIAGVARERDIVFLGNHGVIVCGTRIDHA